MEKNKFLEPELVIIKVEDEEIISTSGTMMQFGYDADAYGDIGALI